MKESIKTIAIIFLTGLFIVNIGIICTLIDIMNDKTQLILDMEREQKVLYSEINNLKVRADEYIELFYSCNDVLVEEGLVGE